MWKTITVFFYFVVNISNAHATFTPTVKNGVGFKLARAVAKDELTANKKGFIISPLSLHLALSMVQNGMSGRTASTMEQYLADLVTVSLKMVKTDVINSEASDLLTKLNQTVEIPSANPDSDKKNKYVVGTHNRAWVNHSPSMNVNYNFKPEYLNLLKKSYRAETSALDFASTDSAKIINKWADNKTNGLISEVVQPIHLRNLLWIIMNATYLEASWAKPFSVLKGDVAPKFKLAGGKSISTPMITGKHNYRYTETEDFQAVELPFRGGSAVMYIVLPATKVNLKDWSTNENGLWSQETWQLLLSEMDAQKQPTTVRLTMPKFTMAYSAEMLEASPLTRDMGLDFLFNNSTNLLNMDSTDSPRSKIGIIKQDAKIELDENGVKAAAVTLIGGAKRGARPPEDVVDMLVDRPYAFAIYDIPTSTFLFVGAVMNPGQKN